MTREKNVNICLPLARGGAVASGELVSALDCGSSGWFSFLPCEAQRPNG